MLRRSLANLFGRRQVERVESPTQADLDAMIDSFFDRELDHESRRNLDAVLESQPRERDRFDTVQDLIDDLRRPVRAPDFTSSVLAEVGRRRPWMPAPLRRYVTAGRMGLAASFLVALAGAWMIERQTPGVYDLREQPAPLTQLVNAGRADAAAGLTALTGAVESLREIPAPEAPQRTKSVTVVMSFAQSEPRNCASTPRSTVCRPSRACADADRERTECATRGTMFVALTPLRPQAPAYLAEAQRAGGSIKRVAEVRLPEKPFRQMIFILPE